MTAGRLAELALALVTIGAGIWLYRRPKGRAEAAGGYGSQGAVLLIVVGAIVAIHALRLLEYRPSAVEKEMAIEGRQ